MPEAMTREALLSSLDGQRTHVLDTLDGLAERELRHSVLPSGWTPLGLLSHLTIDVERFWFRFVVAGEQLTFPTDDHVWRIPAERPVSDVVEAYRAEARRSDDIVRAHSLDAASARSPLKTSSGLPDTTLLATVLHVIAETAGHAGHLDVARELADGHQHLVLTDFTADDAHAQSLKEESR